MKIVIDYNGNNKEEFCVRTNDDKCPHISFAILENW